MFFSSSSTGLPPDAQRAVRDYEQRIGELLDSCADHQRHDPEVFLWNARRALEAMCHLLLTVHRKSPSRVEKATNDTSLDGMIRRLKAEGVLDREQGPRFELARSHTNLGVHIQQPEREDYAAAVADTAHILPGLLEWLYEESIARPYLRAGDKLPTATIREGGREGPSLKDAATSARMQQRTAELTANVLRAELEEKEKALRLREARWWRWLWRMTFTSVACFSFGLCLGLVGNRGIPDGWGALAEVVAPTPTREAAPPAHAPDGDAAPSPVGDAAPSPVGDPAPAPVGDAAPSAVGDAAPSAVGDAAPSPAPSPVAAPLAAPEAVAGPSSATTCPAGMLLVPAIAGMRLGQPVGGRNNWPRPGEGLLEPADVPAFCLDARPRARAVIEAVDLDVDAVDRCERNVVAAARPDARTCVSRDEAERACARAGGHLPGIEEWESAARAGVDGLELPQHEWVGERFPPAVFRRSDPAWEMGDGMWVGRIPKGREPPSPDGAVLLAWNQQPPTNRHVERTFRCAAAPR